MNDLRYAFRQLLKSPAFTLVALATLTLGIGANSAIFSVIDTVLLRSLPFPQADRLTMIWESAPQHPGDERQVHSYPDYLDLRAQNHTFAAMAAYSDASVIWGTGEESEDVPGLAVTSDIFSVLGTPPLFGRGFSRADEKPEAERVVVLSYSFWQRRFAADPHVLGKKVTVSGHPATITGVMPRGWKFPIQAEKVDYLAPLPQLYPEPILRRGSHFLSVVGCLKPGANLRTATADVQTIAAQLARQYPDTNSGRTERVVDLQADVVGDVRPALLVLSAAVALVLLIACANVANLFLARGAMREREIAIRAALGASRFQIVRQLLLETLLLALLGGAAGLVLASWCTEALVALGPADLPRLKDIGVNGFVVAFTFGLALLTSLFFGLIPAMQVSRPQVEQSLKEAARGTTVGRRSHRLRAAFVVSQFALSLVLLVGAGLLMRSFAELRGVKPGFEPRGVLTFWQSLPKARYGEATQQIQFFDKLLSGLASLPGVQDVAMVSPVPVQRQQPKHELRNRRAIGGRAWNGTQRIAPDGRWKLFSRDAHPATSRPHLQRTRPVGFGTSDHGERGVREGLFARGQSARASGKDWFRQNHSRNRWRGGQLKARQPRGTGQAGILRSVCTRSGPLHGHCLAHE